MFWMRIFALLVAIATPLAAGCDAHRARTDFDASAAMGYARAQVAFGPRVPGTPAAKNAGDWIVSEMRQRADTVVVQAWTHVTRQGDTLPLRNILARFKPAASERILYVTHWDTRPTADDDPVLGKRVSSFDGANDGASGVGLFVALADRLKATPPNVGVDLLFVDGEDYGDFDGYEEGAAPDVLIGSTYFGAHLPDPGYQPIYGVLFDMIADSSLSIQEEGNSLAKAPEVVQRVWQAAKDLGYANVFVPQDGGAITDDHVPLLAAGLRVIDVIDYTWTLSDGRNYHHTTLDTMDKLSERSMQAVGDVALKLLRQE
jgi:Zn-dependent M28 family amino/carboxypeptidase